MYKFLVLIALVVCYVSAEEEAKEVTAAAPAETDLDSLAQLAGRYTNSFGTVPSVYNYGGRGYDYGNVGHLGLGIANRNHHLGNRIVNPINANPHWNRLDYHNRRPYHHDSMMYNDYDWMMNRYSPLDNYNHYGLNYNNYNNHGINGLGMHGQYGLGLSNNYGRGIGYDYRIGY